MGICTARLRKGRGRRGIRVPAQHLQLPDRVPLSDRHIEMNVDIDKSHLTGEGVTFAAGQGTKKEVGIC